MERKTTMSRKLIIDGNAVYEIDEECMIKKRLDKEETEKNKSEKDSNNNKRSAE